MADLHCSKCSTPQDIDATVAVEAVSLKSASGQSAGVNISNTLQCKWTCPQCGQQNSAIVAGHVDAHVSGDVVGRDKFESITLIIEVHRTL